MKFKTTLLAAAMVSALSATSAFAESITNVTGRVQYQVSDIQLRSGGLPGDTFAWGDARIGVQTYQPMENGYSVFGHAEYDITANDGLPGLDQDSNGLAPRYVFGGIDLNENGKLTFGRVGSGLLDLYNISDYFAINGGGETMAARAGRLDSSASHISRQDNTIGYENTIEGVKFTTAYIMNSGVFSSTGVDSGYNFSISKEFGEKETGLFKPVFAYQNTTAVDEHITGQPDDNGLSPLGQIQGYEFWGAGFEFTYGDYGFNFVYSEDTLDLADGVDAGKNRGVETLVRYTGIESLDLRAGYFWLENTQYNDDLINDIVFDAHYFLTAKARLIASYSFRNANEFTYSNNGIYSATSGNTQEDFFYLAFRLNF
ncbi:hypothetical protein [uncultured Vibrio sp.]|uniref:porin n=1 Tax=uncultured Vibrio sp. TaxID=114054 RepID=UPI0025F27393|nr:hypothetical protein [uncultured Vibrio sp.]